MKPSFANTVIAGSLRDYHRAKAEAKRARAELVRIAVEHCGLPQDEAMKTDLATFLDGYLVGQGVTPGYRELPVSAEGDLE